MRLLANASLRVLTAWLLLESLSASADISPAEPAPEVNTCLERSEPVALGTALWNGWGRDLDNSRYQPEPALRASDVSKLTLRWSYGYQGGGQFAQPTVVDGRLFVAGSGGRIYSLDAKTGCTYWTFEASVGSQTAVSIGELGQSKKAVLPKKLKRTLAHLDVIKAPSVAIFGDDSGSVYALDAQRGTLVWKTQVDPNPLGRIVAAPTLYNNRLYVSVALGSVAALDLATGRILWRSFTVLGDPQPTRAGAGVLDAPTIDPKRDVLYVGTSDSSTSAEQSLTDAVVALDLSDGKLRWVKQLARSGAAGSSGFSASPVLRNLAGGHQVILAGQRSGAVYSLDPDHGGEILWQSKVSEAGVAAGGIAWGLATDYKNVYVGLSGVLADPAVTAGSLAALEMKSGIARWRTASPTPPCSWGEGACSHALSQAVTVMPGAAFAGSMDGHFRAYSTIDGKVLWDFDTAQPLHPVNGVGARGGPLDHGGATVVNGMVYVNSGNALLAFSTASSPATGVPATGMPATGMPATGMPATGSP